MHFRCFSISILVETQAQQYTENIRRTIFGRPRDLPVEANLGVPEPGFRLGSGLKHKRLSFSYDRDR